MPDRRAALKARLLTIFRTEAGDHLQSIAEQAKDWSAAPGQGRIEELFRVVHTLKGAARSVGQQDVEGLCHELETELSRARRGDREAVERAGQMLGPTIDRLRRAILALPTAAGPAAPAAQPGQSQPTPETAARPAAATPDPPGSGPDVTTASTAAAVPGVDSPEAPAAPPPATGSAPVATGGATVRVDMAGLDRLLRAVDDLTGLRVALDRRAAALAEAIDAAAPAAGAGRSRLESALSRIRRAIQQDRLGLEATLATLGEEARRLRTATVRSVLEVLPPMLEDIGRAQGKPIEVTTEGLDRVLDRRVLETVKDPLIHIARNAIDHGIESPDERRRVGKPATAQIAIRIVQRDDRRVAISVEDDGRGIDLDRVRAAAGRLRLLPADELAALAPEQITELVFRSGLSTSSTVTALSGHGLGLAIARDRIEGLGGHVELRSAPGSGLSVTLVVPTTISTFRGLQVHAGGQAFLLPMEAIAGVLHRPAEEHRETAVGRTLAWRERAIPVAHLSDILGLDESASDRGADHIVVVEAGDECGALVVEAIEGEHVLLLKPLPSPLVRVRNVSAAAMLADGELTLVLRPGDLLRSLHVDRARATAAGVPARRAPPRVLIVDDSVTTRLMEQNLFEAAGYDVRLAADGLEALALLRDVRVDLVVSDVDMPGLDGFELTRRIRADARLSELPVVLVTALESREDKEEGLRAGANAYVTKSDFDQTRLLEIVGRMT